MTQQTFKWPDLSSYGLHFGFFTLPDGSDRLVMVDNEGAWQGLAKEMGFTQSDWAGLYIMLVDDSKTKPQLKLNMSKFPAGSVVLRTTQELRDHILPLIMERTKFRLDRGQIDSKRMSWKPDAKPSPIQRAIDDIAPADNLSPEAHADVHEVLGRREFVGLNALGQEVFALGTGIREVTAGGVTTSESTAVGSNPTLFLRADSQEALIEVATGLVRMMESGRGVTAADAERYIEAASGEGASTREDAVRQFHWALDQAINRVVRPLGTSFEAFQKAAQLHEARPSFWNPSNRFSAPAPVLAAMRHLVTSHASALPDAAAAVYADILPDTAALNALHRVSHDAPHRISVSTAFMRMPAGGDSQEARTPTYREVNAAWSALQHRDPEGVSVFWLPVERAGRLDAVARRFLSNIGRAFEIDAVLDLDPALLGAGNSQATRLVVVGKKLAKENEGFSTPVSTTVLMDYDELWAACERLTTGVGGELQFGEREGMANRWQAPYIPASKVSEPDMMIPRNLVAPVRRAIADLEARHGMTVDEFAMDRLQWNKEQLTKALSAEQVDAFALSVDQIEHGSGFVNTDETGVGKGRHTAALARYAKLQGRKAILLTGSADLFSDFYRDVQAIGALQDLNRPFLVNSNHIIRDLETGAEIARSASTDVQQKFFSCGEYPEEYSLILSTYSQFNRRYNPSDAAPAVAISRAIRAMINTEMEPFEAICSIAEHLGMPNYASMGIKDLEAAAAHEEAQAGSVLRLGRSLDAETHKGHAAMLRLPKAQLLEKLGSLLRSDNTTLKHQWLYSGALDGAIVIGDESHLAAGETSQTGVNLQHLMDRSSGATYASATYSKDINNFLLYAKLFPPAIRVHSIAGTLKRGGEVMQEILSSMLASDGKLIRREHDLSTIDMKVMVDEKRKERHEYMAGQFADVLAALSYLSGEVSEEVAKMNEKFDTDHKSRHKEQMRRNPGALASALPSQGVQYTNFASKFYNITRVFMMALNSENAADLAVQALREGKKPVISVQNTLDSVLEELIAGVDLGDEDLPDATPIQLTGDSALQAQPSLLAAATNDGVTPLGRRVGFKDILIAYMDSLFEARLQTRQKNKMVDSKRISLATPALEAARENIREMMKQMPEVPLSPLDHVRSLIKAEGFSVNEISGRKYQLVETEDGNHAVMRYPKRNKQNIVRAFNNGDLDCTILSLAGSTGISMHASRDFKDQRQRVMIELQIPNDVTQRKQMLGRCARKGAVNDLLVWTLSTGLPAELRIIMMQNDGLRKMSANTSGSADNAHLKEDVPSLRNAVGNEVAFRWMETNPKVSSLIGYKIGEFQEDKVALDNTKFVDLLTNRLVMLKPALQHTVFNELTAETKALIEQYELEGNNPLKSANLDIKARTTGEMVLQESTGRKSAFDGNIVAKELTYAYDLPALSQSSLLEAADAGRAELSLEYGESFAQVISKKVSEQAQLALPDLLPKRFDSIEQAMADSGKNALKNALVKFEWLANEILDLTPGSVISYRESENAAGVGAEAGPDTSNETLFITGWKLPNENFLSLSEYKIKAISLKTRKSVEMSLSAWYSRPKRWHKYTYDERNPYQAGSAAQEFFRQAALPLKGEQSRIALVGNMYRAAELADSQRTGSAVSFSDDKGVWHHGILMPKATTLANVRDLPIVIDNEATMIAALASIKPGAPPLRITDDMRSDIHSKRTYLIAGHPGDLQVYTYGDRKSSWLGGDKEVRDCLVGGKFISTRNYNRGAVRRGMEAQFLQVFMKAANEAGASVTMGGEMRGWYNRHLAALNVETVSQKTADAALSDAANEEISKLLAAAP